LEYKVQISDRDGQSFRVRLEIPFISTTTNPNNSSFRVLDSGYIRYSSGGCNAAKDSGPNPTDIQFVVFKSSGLCLNAMFDWAGFVNSSGDGKLSPSWATGAKAGPINWVLLEDED
jgi:hypothetical protein